MERKQLIYDIAKTYICKYTCATMADSWGTVVYERNEADDELFEHINSHHITQDEMREAVNQIENEAKESGSACIYDKELFSTKFFRK